MNIASEGEVRSPARPQDLRDFRGVLAYYDEDANHGGFAKLFKNVKKYVVSRSGDVDTSWQGSVLLRDIAELKRLREEDGPNRVTHGSIEHSPIRVKRKRRGKSA